MDFRNWLGQKLDTTKGGLDHLSRMRFQPAGVVTQTYMDKLRDLMYQGAPRSQQIDPRFHGRIPQIPDIKEDPGTGTLSSQFQIDDTKIGQEQLQDVQLAWQNFLKRLGQDPEKRELVQKLSQVPDYQKFMKKDGPNISITIPANL